MSIQIYGYKSNKSLKETFDLLKNSYDDFYQVFINHIKKEYACYICYRIDKSIVDKTCSSITIDDIKNEFYESIKNNDENVLIGLYPYNEDITFIQNFSSNIYWNIFHKFNFQEYHYSTSTEKPDDLTEEEWQKRCDDWQQIMPDWIPANNCVQYNPIFKIPNIFEWTYEDLKELFDSLIPSIRVYGYLRAKKSIYNDKLTTNFDNISKKDLPVITKDIYEGKTKI